MRKIGVEALAVLLFVAGLIGVGCNKRNPDPFPTSGVVPGWQKSGETRTFAAADLWQYMDGGADQYVNAGVVTTSTSDYKFRGNLEAVVDIYTFKASDGATKMYEANPASNSKTTPLGDAARLYGQSLVFRKGHYLVRIMAYESAPNEADALLALGHGVEGRL